jgi:TRAP-type C4-dicarboxylate transport system permease small subunit
VQRLIRIVETAAGLSLALMTLVTLAAVALRVGFSRGVPDGYDIASQLLGIAILWGFAPATYSGKHIVVDVLWEKCGAGGKRAIDTFAGLVTLAFLGAMSWMLMGRVAEVFASNLATAELRIPVWPFFAVAATGVAAAAALALLRLLQTLGGRPA